VSGGITITGENFEKEVLKSPVPVLIDFWATWCGPCKMIAPFIEQIAGEYSGRVKVGKVDVDEEPSLAEKHGIVSIPTLVLYKDGEIADQRGGAIPKHDIETMLNHIL
jgi:thioredoxin 1